MLSLIWSLIVFLFLIWLVLFLLKIGGALVSLLLIAALVLFIVQFFFKKSK
ncbi:hypothetical protein M3N64_07125 [Sporolactobacillus sp. CPB3-1]|uniref:Lmo0937 family membrane protein n=1 Tax=Sporolactobacillus mangiferae TaxID=2940498 RepID=A0ABT0MBJ9_9BACL|nr:DUF5670 family protein [Sporolactobacillus mangiferae]MCL1631720.1 hypothetical protein [Sporolactobacillus mangiferae]